MYLLSVHVLKWKIVAIFVVVRFGLMPQMKKIGMMVEQ